MPPGPDRDLLLGTGDRVLACELRSDMGFTGAEAVVRDVTARLGAARSLVLDLSQVGSLQPVAVTMLSRLAGELGRHGFNVVAADPRGRGLLGGHVPERASLAGALLARAARLAEDPREVPPRTDHRRSPRARRSSNRT